MGYYETLKEEIFKLSFEKQDFQEACLEWFLKCVEHADKNSEWSNCACTHDIKNRYVIRNKKTNKTITVGSCCINHFESQLKLVGKAVKENRINLALILEAKQYLSDWEYSFILDIYRKRVFSKKQLAKYEAIKAKILLHYQRDSHA